MSEYLRDFLVGMLNAVPFFLLMAWMLAWFNRRLEPIRKQLTDIMIALAWLQGNRVAQRKRDDEANAEKGDQ